MARVLALTIFSVTLLSTSGIGQTVRPATPALALESTSFKTHSADLTTIAQRNGGSFPRQRVASFVDGTSRPLPAHGTDDMPVWGSAFRGLESSDARVEGRLANLVAYVESLQRPPNTVQSNPGSAPVTGAQLFRTYCASCHGETARGTGPLSAELKRPIPDLTTYTARNGGVFPGQRLRQIIDGRGPAAHGDRTMPVWGVVFGRQADATDDALVGRIDALVTYLQSIQQRGAE